MPSPAHQYRNLLEADELPPLDLNVIAREHAELLNRAVCYTLERANVIARFTRGEDTVIAVSRCLHAHMGIVNDIQSGWTAPTGAAKVFS